MVPILTATQLAKGVIRKEAFLIPLLQLEQTGRKVKVNTAQVEMSVGFLHTRQIKGKVPKNNILDYQRGVLFPADM